MPTFCETSRARVQTFEFLVHDFVYCVIITMLLLNMLSRILTVDILSSLQTAVISSGIVQSD